MNLRFDAHGIRVRLGEGEFARLLAGETLAMAVGWPGGIRWGVTLVRGGALAVDADDTQGVRIVVPGHELEALAGRLPSRDGLDYRLEAPAGPLTLVLQVDVRDGRRQRPR